MTRLALWIHTPLAQALGRTLAHFVWEGAALSALLLLPVRRRYALACLTLVAMPIAFVVTLAIVYTPAPAVIASPIHWTAIPESSAPLAVPASSFSWTEVLNRLSWLVPFWFAGVAFFYARGLAGWATVQRLRRRGTCAAPPEWQARLDRLAERLRISRPVALLESCLTDTPVLVGHLRPVVLLPIGCLTGLSTAQVECILVHELAHVARHDYLVNLLQSVVEGLLFYHPAVWWVSRVMRSERENCCDDRVVEVLGDARAYAATLATLEQRRSLSPALAANGGNLMKRIRRLTMDTGPAPTSAAPAVSAAVLLLILAVALAAVPAKTIAAPPPPTQQAASDLTTPYRAWLNQDVVYIITDEERTAFNKLTNDQEREQFIENFWLRRDPTPGTVENEFREEHYRRIAYVNEHFASSTAAGWQTDRGRTYIVYGPPDEIEDHSSGGRYIMPPAAGGGETSTYPFQDWRYRFIQGIGNNVEMEFVDPTGSGDFHMTTDPHEKEAIKAPEANNRQRLQAFVAWQQRNQEIEAKSKQLRPALASPYRQWLNQDVAYIITDQERSAFLRLQTDESREQFVKNFWLQRGDAVKAEHDGRVAYANEHFGAVLPGWKTDRGRIYIMYGPPDAISHPAQDLTTWSYRNTGMSFQFRDVGNGDFELIANPKQEQEAQVLASNGSSGVSVIALPRPVAQPPDKVDLSLADKVAECGSLEQKYTPQHPQLAQCLAELRSMAAQQSPHAAVSQDGIVISAAALTDSVRVVNVLVPLANTGDEFHIIGQITKNQKLVFTFEEDKSGGGRRSVVKATPLKPGTYHLAIATKNMATGNTKQSELDFTVE
jgi:GWxTD domain-containing protein